MIENILLLIVYGYIVVAMIHLAYCISKEIERKVAEWKLERDELKFDFASRIKKEKGERAIATIEAINDCLLDCDAKYSGTTGTPEEHNEKSALLFYPRASEILRRYYWGEWPHVERIGNRDISVWEH